MPAKSVPWATFHLEWSASNFSARANCEVAHFSYDEEEEEGGEEEGKGGGKGED